MRSKTHSSTVYIQKRFATVWLKYNRSSLSVYIQYTCSDSRGSWNAPDPTEADLLTISIHSNLVRVCVYTCTYIDTTTKQILILYMKKGLSCFNKDLNFLSLVAQVLERTERERERERRLKWLFIEIHRPRLFNTVQVLRGVFCRPLQLLSVKLVGKLWVGGRIVEIEK